MSNLGTGQAGCYDVGFDSGDTKIKLLLQFTVSLNNIKFFIRERAV
jgi:hypothetical protein